MKYQSALFSLFISISSISNAALIPISDEVQVESVNSFTKMELWSSTAPISKAVGDIIVNYRIIDAEVPIHRGKWKQCGMVMIGDGDIGTNPVAFRVWTKQACDLSMQASEAVSSSRSTVLEFIVREVLI